MSAIEKSIYGTIGALPGVVERGDLIHESTLSVIHARTAVLDIHTWGHEAYGHRSFVLRGGVPKRQRGAVLQILQPHAEAVPERLS